MHLRITETPTPYPSALDVVEQSRLPLPQPLYNEIGDPEVRKKQLRQRAFFQAGSYPSQSFHIPVIPIF